MFTFIAIPRYVKHRNYARTCKKGSCETHLRLMSRVWRPTQSSELPRYHTLHVRNIRFTKRCRRWWQWHQKVFNHSGAWKNEGTQGGIGAIVATVFPHKRSNKWDRLRQTLFRRTRFSRILYLFKPLVWGRLDRRKRGWRGRLDETHGSGWIAALIVPVLTAESDFYPLFFSSLSFSLALFPIYFLCSSYSFPLCSFAAVKISRGRTVGQTTLGTSASR